MHAPDRPASAACPSGTCPGRWPWIRPKTPRSRLACSERTPTMKKAPRPTASRITRVWLPGREMWSTAWRSGNDGAFASGATTRTSNRPVSCSTTASAENPAHTIRPTRSDAACQDVNADQRGRHEDHGADLRPVASGGRRFVAQQQRRLDECARAAAARPKTAATPARRCQSPAPRR